MCDECSRRLRAQTDAHNRRVDEMIARGEPLTGRDPVTGAEWVTGYFGSVGDYVECEHQRQCRSETP